MKNLLRIMVRVADTGVSKIQVGSVIGGLDSVVDVSISTVFTGVASAVLCLLTDDGVWTASHVLEVVLGSC
jgi:hypothetical protein